MAERRDDSLQTTLRAQGYRLTPQRQLVLQAVTELRHGTPDEICVEVQRTAGGVNISTIYRTLELLEELDLVTHTHLSHGAPTYHDAHEAQHVHLVCRACGHVQEVDPVELGPLAGRLAEERGFRLDIAHVALFGLCKGCSS